MFKRGSIRKIEVSDFVTYNHVSLYPGPNLNMLVGPNGTGKSTIVAAIILGLGGNPKVVGRGNKIGEYVKHHCSQATINLTLQGDNENSFTKITRVFTNQDKSSWAINGQKVKDKEFEEYIRSLNIQVDNLCQFLPQDRVQDFAKLNQQELLKATQVALCREDLVNRQKELVALSSELKSLSGSLESSEKKLKEYQDANIRLEGKVANFNKKKEYMNHIQHIERKIAWIKYDELYEKIQSTKNDLQKATELYEKHRAEIRPMEKQIAATKSAATELQQRNSNVTRNIRECENSIHNCTEKFESYKQKIQTIEDDASVEIAQLEQKLIEIQTSGDKIEQMRAMQRSLLEQAGNSEQVQQQVKKFSIEMQKCNEMIEGLHSRREDLVRSRQDSNAQVRGYEHEVARLENVKQQKLEKLRRRDQDAYAGVTWLRQNKHLFKGEVFEPMMLEINVLDPSKAKYVENVIPHRDKVAFTCVHKEDMTLLIRSLREQQRLSVNVLHTGDGSASEFQPSIPIEQLKCYGFYTYVKSLFTAPEPIMRYLCRNHNVHNIPVGNQMVNSKLKEIPSHVRFFFSENETFSVRYSKYSNQKSTSQSVIHSDGLLSISMDLIRMETLKTKIQQFKNSADACEEQMKSLDNQLKVVNEKSASIEKELQQIRSLRQQIHSIESRIDGMQRRVDEMRQEVKAPELVQEEAKKRIKKVMLNMQQLRTEICSINKSLCKLKKKKDVNLIKIGETLTRAALLENQIAESRRSCQEAEVTLNNVREVYADIKGQARAALQKAKGLSNNFSPDDAGFDLFREVFDKLTEDLRQLQDEKNQLLIKVDCLSAADDEEVREYEERVKLIEELESKMSKRHADLSKMTDRIEQLKQEWLEPLQQLILEINVRFASAFEKMGCAGEVSLNIANDEREFSQYGLRIKVTYRNGEPLQELNNVVQSGGERAVATAAFMLSLQELTPVPFRCVDEINQGMDPDNERRIFDLLVDTTSSENTSQYFLITPKLVPHLKFSRNMLIHIVHNGPFVKQDKKWFASRLCNPQRVQL